MWQGLEKTCIGIFFSDQIWVIKTEYLGWLTLKSNYYQTLIDFGLFFYSHGSICCILQVPCLQIWILSTQECVMAFWMKTITKSTWFCWTLYINHFIVIGIRISSHFFFGINFLKSCNAKIQANYNIESIIIILIPKGLTWWYFPNNLMKDVENSQVFLMNTFETKSFPTLRTVECPVYPPKYYPCSHKICLRVSPRYKLTPTNSLVRTFLRLVLCLRYPPVYCLIFTRVSNGHHICII
jgi:hypothetical protein